MKLIKLLLIFFLSGCAVMPPNADQACHEACNNLIKAEDERFNVCEAQVNSCIEQRKKDNPPLVSKVVWALLGFGAGFIIATKVKQ